MIKFDKVSKKYDENIVVDKVDFNIKIRRNSKSIGWTNFYGRNDWNELWSWRQG